MCAPSSFSINKKAINHHQKRRGEVAKTAMPAMIACERCDELGGLSGFGGLLGDVSFDAVPIGNGNGNGGRLATASAGQLVGK